MKHHSPSPLNARVQISAGSGPQEVARFVALLGRRLARRCAELDLQITDGTVHGAEAAPRSLVLCVEGAAIEQLRSEEQGTHALVLRSTVRTGCGRKRWFASVVFLSPVAPSSATLRATDVEAKACRAGGPGGQNVNKRNTAVRACHRATGLSVRADTHRRQADNRRLAFARLAEKIERQQKQRMADARFAARQHHWQLIRGQPVKTYRLNRSGELEEKL